MIALVLLGLLITVGVSVILGWTPDSRDDEQKLWPLERPATPPHPRTLSTRSRGASS
jgi:hypothetical protein